MKFLILLCFASGAKAALAEAEINWAPRGDSAYNILYNRNDLIKRVSPNRTDQSGKTAEYPALYTKSDLQSLESDAVVSVNDLLKIKTLKSVDSEGMIQGVGKISPNEFLDYQIIAPQTEYQNTVAGLLFPVKIKGPADTEYYIVPKQENNLLVFYKAGAPETVAYHELPTAKAFGDLLATPLIAYPMQNCMAEKLFYRNKQATEQYLPVCHNIKRGDYILLNTLAINGFQHIDKTDVFPRDFFSGQWLYQRTVLSTENDRITESPSYQVEFHPDIDKLRGIAAKEGAMYIFIPVQWVDFQVRRNDSGYWEHFSEKMITGSYEEPLRYLRIPFEKLTEFDSHPDYEIKLKDVRLTDDRFEFDIGITEKDRKDKGDYDVYNPVKTDTDSKKDTDTWLITYTFQRLTNS